MGQFPLFNNLHVLLTVLQGPPGPPGPPGLPGRILGLNGVSFLLLHFILLIVDFQSMEQVYHDEDDADEQPKSFFLDM